MEFFDSRRTQVLKSPLTLNGAGATANAGAANHNAARFSFIPQDQNIMPLGFMMVIEDEDAAYNKFGNINALSTGLSVLLEKVAANALVLDLLGGATITDVQAAFRLGADVTPLNDSTGATRSTKFYIPLFQGQTIIHEDEKVSVKITADLTQVSGVYFWLVYERLGGFGQ